LPYIDICENSTCYGYHPVSSDMTRDEITKTATILDRVFRLLDGFIDLQKPFSNGLCYHNMRFE
jgi:hypothetical protein